MPHALSTLNSYSISSAQRGKNSLGDLTGCAFSRKHYKLGLAGHSGVCLVRIGQFTSQDTFENRPLDSLRVGRVPDITNSVAPPLRVNIVNIQLLIAKII